MSNLESGFKTVNFQRALDEMNDKLHAMDDMFGKPFTLAKSCLMSEPTRQKLLEQNKFVYHSMFDQYPSTCFGIEVIVVEQCPFGLAYLRDSKGIIIRTLKVVE